MVNEYFESDITIDSKKLLTEILKESAGKQLTTVIRSLNVEDQEVTVETLTRDIKISLGLDPFQARRAAKALVKNKFVVPVFAAEIAYTYDDYLRINKTKHNVQALVGDVAVEIGDQEDAFILTATDIAPGDNEGIAEKGTAFNYNSVTALVANDFATGVSSLAAMIGQLVNGMKGEVRKNPMILTITPNVESVAAGTLNTNSDKSLLQAWDEQLKLRGGPGSGILVAENLGCTVAVDGELKVISLTTVDSKAALVCKSPKVMTTFASKYDQRPRPFNKADGYYNKVVERWINLVHNALGIIYESAVTVS